MSDEEAVSTTPSSSRQRSTLRWALVGSTALLVGAGVMLRQTAPAPEPVDTAPVMGVLVDTLTVASQPLQYRVSVSGLVEARRTVELYAEQSGRVLEVGAEELDRVQAGQVLVRVDPLPGEVEVARAEATLAQAQSELELAAMDLDRARRLTTNKISSKSQLDRATTTQQVATAVHRAATASLRSARDRLSQRTLIAPFDGVLRRFDPEAGEYVSPGQQLGELLEVSRVRVTVGLRDRDVVAVAPGMPARVRIDALSDRTFPGTVTRVAAAADTTMRKFPVQIELDNAEGLVLPGMVATIDLELGKLRSAVIVPSDVVLDEFGLPFVYVVSQSPEGGTFARRRRVVARSVPFQPGTIEVTEGIDVGERIATTALRQLQDGTRIEVRPRLGARTDFSK